MTFRRLCALLHKKQVGRDAGEALRVIPGFGTRPPVVCLHCSWDPPRWGWPMLSGAAGSLEGGWSISYQPRTVLPTAQSWLMGGRRVKSASLGGWGTCRIPHKSQNCWLLALLPHRGHGWRKVSPSWHIPSPTALPKLLRGHSPRRHPGVPETRSQTVGWAAQDFSQRPAEVRPSQNKCIWACLLKRSLKVIISP